MDCRIWGLRRCGKNSFEVVKTTSFFAVIARKPCDEAIQGSQPVAPGLLRSARNDGGCNAMISLRRLTLAVNAARSLRNASAVAPAVRRPAHGRTSPRASSAAGAGRRGRRPARARSRRKTLSDGVRGQRELARVLRRAGRRARPRPRRSRRAPANPRRAGAAALGAPAAPRRRRRGSGAPPPRAIRRRRSDEERTQDLGHQADAGRRRAVMRDARRARWARPRHRRR